MAKFVLDFGREVDMLTKGELDASLAEAEDTRLRALVAGVKLVEQFHNIQQTGGASVVYTTPPGPPYSPAGGFVWAVMNIGLETAVSTAVRIYKGVPNLGASNAPIGSGRVAGTTGSSVTPNSQFSKGQLLMRAGDQLTFVASAGSAFILSVFISAIEIPAERIGELLL